MAILATDNLVIERGGAHYKAPVSSLPAPVASLGFLSVEVNLGNRARRGGKFVIAGAGLVAGKPVLVQQAVGPYTGKGTLADEAEMDQLTAVASVTSATEITGYWRSTGPMRGNVKLNYVIGA